MMRNKLLNLGAAVLAFGLVACEEGDSLTEPGTTAAAAAPAAEDDVLDGRAGLPTIADIAISNPNFSILEAALGAAGLVETFDGRRQYTVFAPTDGAFAALLDDLGLTAGELLANSDLLTAVLLYHATPGNRNSTSVLASGQVRMLNGQFAPTSTPGGVPSIDGATIVTPDIRASNGTIHVIDAVLLPEGL